MPLLIDLEREQRALSDTLRSLSDAGRLRSEEGFTTAVEFATNSLSEGLSKPTEAKMAAEHYIRLHDLGYDILPDIQNFIDSSREPWTEQDQLDPQLAFRILVYMASGIRRGHKPYPEILCDWMSIVIEEAFLDKDENNRHNPWWEGLQKKIEEWHSEFPNALTAALLTYASYKDEPTPKYIPTSRGRKRDTNRIRDSAFRDADYQLGKFGFTSTRSIEQGGKRYDFCCFEGGSCADIIGVAYQKVTGKKSKYKTIASIIRDPKHRNAST